jgi:hypothetical protein
MARKVKLHKRRPSTTANLRFSVATNQTTVDEGDTIAFTISATGHVIAGAESVTLNIAETGTCVDADFTNTWAAAIAQAEGETTGVAHAAGVLTFTPGAQQITISRTLTNDVTTEGTQTTGVTISSPSAGSITAATVSVSVLDTSVAPTSGVPVVNDQTFPLGRKTRSLVAPITVAVASGGTPTSWSITAGDASNHFDIDTAGQISVTATGQNNLAASYTLTVEATNTSGSDTATITIDTEANAYDWTTGTQLDAAIANAISTGLTGEIKFYLPDGKSATEFLPGARVFSGATLTDANSSVVATPAGVASYNRNATAAFSGTWGHITCRTRDAGIIAGPASGDKTFGFVGCSGFEISNLKFTRIKSASNNPASSLAQIHMTRTDSRPTYGKFHIHDITIDAYSVSTDYLLLPAGIWVINADEVIVEDCTIRGAYIGMDLGGARRGAARRNDCSQMRVDAYRVMLTKSAATGGAKARMEFSDNLAYDPLVPPVTAIHKDSLQLGNPGDQVGVEVIVWHNYFYLHGPGDTVDTNCILFDDTSFTYQGVVAHNFCHLTSTRGINCWREDPTNDFNVYNNLVVKDTTLDHRTVGNPTAAGIYANPTVLGGGPNVVITNNVAGLYSLGDATDGGGNVTITHTTANTGAGNSMPENFAGPFTSAAWGWQFTIREDTAAHCRADIEAVFTPVAASSADGKVFITPP